MRGKREREREKQRDRERERWFTYYKDDIDVLPLEESLDGGEQEEGVVGAPAQYEHYNYGYQHLLCLQQNN